MLVLSPILEGVSEKEAGSLTDTGRRQIIMEPYMVGSIVAILFTLLTIAVSIAAIAFWVWMVIDCATKEPSEGNDKIAWLLIILLTNIVGALIYYFVRRPQRRTAFPTNGIQGLYRRAS
jgi:hypothetical protein